jgi:hypothetical protein
MATLVELEPELGSERRAVSRESRRSRSLPATKPTKLNAERQEQLRRLAETGEPVRELSAAFGIGRATAYRYSSQYGLAPQESQMLGIRSTGPPLHSAQTGGRRSTHAIEAPSPASGLLSPRQVAVGTWIDRGDRAATSVPTYQDHQILAAPV